MEVVSATRNETVHLEDGERVSEVQTIISHHII